MFDEKSHTAQSSLHCLHSTWSVRHKPIQQPPARRQNPHMRMFNIEQGRPREKAAEAKVRMLRPSRPRPRSRFLQLARFSMFLSSII